MEAHSRQRFKSYADENAVVAQKQASAAAGPAAAPPQRDDAPKRAALQPVAQNGYLAKRSLAPPPASLPLQPLQQQQQQQPQPLRPAAADASGMRSVPGRIDDSPGSDATIEDVEAFDEEGVLLEHEHTHSASFEDDENDGDDELRLKLALQQLPPTAINPHALFPEETVHSRLILDRCAQIVSQTPGLLDADDEDTWDASMVLEYADEIFKHMRIMELRLLPDRGYMEHQKELSWSLRGVLIDWLVQIHARFNLLPETLFLCVNYIDRFLTVKEVNLTRFQLVGAVALFIAAKYEEINYLSIQEVSQMVENNYSVEEILGAERFMIDKLDFNLGFPGPMSFLRRVSKADDYDLETRTLAKYLLELTIMDERFVAAPPSWTAAIAHYMARHMLRQGPWTPRHIHFSGYTEDALLSGVAAVREAISVPTEHHNAIFEKYTGRKFRKASTFVQNWVQLAAQHPELDFSAPEEGI